MQFRDMTADRDAPLFQRLSAQGTREDERRRDASGEMASTPVILESLILYMSRIIRVGRPQ